MKKLCRFLISVRQNTYMNFWFMNVYVRKGQRWEGEYKYHTFEIANIEVKEAFRGKGMFSRWLDEIEETMRMQNRVVLFDSVKNDRLKSYLVRRGYPFTLDEFSETSV